MQDEKRINDSIIKKPLKDISVNIFPFILQIYSYWCNFVKYFKNKTIKLKKTHMLFSKSQFFVT